MFGHNSLGDQGMYTDEKKNHNHNVYTAQRTLFSAHTKEGMAYTVQEKYTGFRKTDEKIEGKKIQNITILKSVVRIVLFACVYLIRGIKYNKSHNNAPHARSVRNKIKTEQ